MQIILSSYWTWAIELVVFIFCSCTSQQGTSYHKYTQPLNSQIGLSHTSIELDRSKSNKWTRSSSINQVRSIEFNRLLRETDLWVQGLVIVLTASALAGASAKKHDRVRSIEFNRLLRETNLWVQGLRKFLTAKKHDLLSTIDRVQLIIERDLLVSSRFAYIFDS